MLTVILLLSYVWLPALYRAMSPYSPSGDPLVSQEYRYAPSASLAAVFRCSESTQISTLAGCAWATVTCTWTGLLVSVTTRSVDIVSTGQI